VPQQKLVPFTITVPEERQDPALPEKLRAELSGILRWAVEGCLLWQRDGLGTPSAVREATQAWREESDALGGFLAGCCEVGAGFEATSKDLYAAYLQYCEANGDESLKLWRGVRLPRATGPDSASC
jgi:putative DNA primase/helicase